jgi:hypothetical protein
VSQLKELLRYYNLSNKETIYLYAAKFNLVVKGNSPITSYLQIMPRITVELQCDSELQQRFSQSTTSIK